MSDIFEELQNANLPKEEFIVLGSGILAALGIRKAGDIDILVRPALFAELKNRAWKYEVIEIAGRPREKVSKGVIEAFKDFWWEEGEWELNKAFEIATKIRGVLFIPLRMFLTVKKKMNRDKDRKDVVLIEKYLSEHAEA